MFILGMLFGNDSIGVFSRLNGVFRCSIVWCRICGFLRSVILFCLIRGGGVGMVGVSNILNLVSRWLRSMWYLVWCLCVVCIFFLFRVVLLCRDISVNGRKLGLGCWRVFVWICVVLLSMMGE